MILIVKRNICDTCVKVYLSKAQKEKIKKLVYKNNITMSHYLRNLILIDNKLRLLEQENVKVKHIMEDLKCLNYINGRIIDE